MILLMILFVLIMSACVTNKEIITVKYVLPPIPQREELPQLTQNPTAEDYLLIINYYEHLVQQWELWGNNVNKLLSLE